MYQLQESVDFIIIQHLHYYSSVLCYYVKNSMTNGEWWISISVSSTVATQPEKIKQIFLKQTFKRIKKLIISKLYLALHSCFMWIFSFLEIRYWVIGNSKVLTLYIGSEFITRVYSFTEIIHLVPEVQSSAIEDVK